MGNLVSRYVCPDQNKNLTSKKKHLDDGESSIPKMTPRVLKQKIRNMKLHFGTPENKTSLRLSHRSKEPTDPAKNPTQILREVSEPSLQNSSSNQGTSSEAKKVQSSMTELEEKMLYIIEDHHSPQRSLFGFDKQKHLRMLARVTRECEKRLKAVDNMISEQNGIQDAS